MIWPAPYNKYKTLLLMAIAILLLFLNGCHTGRYTIEEPFGEEQLKRIQKGVTIKSDIIKWFGPPPGISRRGEVMVLPFALSGRIIFEKVPLDLNEIIKPQKVNEFFASRHEIADHHIIYCYYYIKELQILFYRKLFIHNLWLLINKENGLVEDYLLRKEDVMKAVRKKYRENMREVEEEEWEDMM